MLKFFFPLPISFQANQAFPQNPSLSRPVMPGMARFMGAFGVLSGIGDQRSGPDWPRIQGGGAFAPPNETHRWMVTHHVHLTRQRLIMVGTTPMTVSDIVRVACETCQPFPVRGCSHHRLGI
ncbi:uncharacterized protein B0T23DRAFT_10949 [Neurospora hispaniola]|uniref:Uncharacterized protein n=1 Tax=Neurospora hispaniola TaxID=588809 RepID=A0AAJ0IF59_9PEZI|nr:hypothetical protein B0T23DRAFT_10949 [Neurospora hispaniola]